MIRGLHGLFYSSDPEATRAFLRDKMKLPFTDTGGGWLIFDLPASDLGVHPLDDSGQPPAGTHDVSFYCDDIAGTMAEMKARGVTFRMDPAADHGYGYVTYLSLPGGLEIQLYEPKYKKRPAARSATKKTAPRPPARAAAKTRAKANPAKAKPAAKAKAKVRKR